MNPQNSPSTANHTAPKEDQLRAAYRSLISSSLASSFPSFVRNFDSQQGPVAQRGRAAVVRFEVNGKTTTTRFTSATHLKECLDTEAPILFSSTSPTPKRHLYLLEDISRDFVEILGSRLRIPPDVFATHWSDPATSRGTYDDVRLVSYNPHYFRLRYRQLHQIKGNYPLGLYGDRNSNVLRWLQLLDKDRRFESSGHHLSFWATAYGQGSWIVILLVDPVVTQAVLRPDEIQARSYPDGFRLHINHPESGRDALPYPHPMSTTILPPNPGDWISNAKGKPVSLFDGTIEHYEHSFDLANEDPRSATLASRRLVLYMWRGFLRSLDEEFHFLSDQMHYRQSPNDIHGWFNTWRLGWREEVFRKLSYGKTVIDGTNSNLRAVFETLDIGSDNSIVDKYEASNWRSLQDAGKALATKFDNLIAEYVQEGGIQESRGVGRLTKLATVLVPISITAGIFSMGDDYLVGKSRFWVFWAVAIPLVLLSSILVFTSLVPSLWLRVEKLVFKIQGRWPPLREKSDRR